MKLLEGGKDSGPLNVLVAESSEEEYSKIRHLFQQLKQARYSLDWAQTTDEALARLKSGNFHACLLDHLLDSNGGLDFLKVLHENEVATPIILLSGGNSVDNDISALRAGASDYLNKGRLLPGFLHRSIRFALERKKNKEDSRLIENQLTHSQKLKTLGQLAASMAHDLNNALGAVMGHLDLIQMATKNDSEVALSTDRAIKGCQRAASLAQHILAYSQERDSALEMISLDTLVRETSQILARILPAKINVTTQINEDCAAFLIQGNVAQIRQSLINLALNAQAAMPHGGRLTLSMTQGKSNELLIPEGRDNTTSYIVLTVQDSGIGMDKEACKRVLQPDFTSKYSSNGLGLGLPAVLNTLSEHQGWINIESKVGLGTSVHLYFPAKDESFSQLDLKNLKEDLPPESKTKTKGKILVIEDEAPLVELMKLYLQAANFESKGFTNPEHALEWYEKHFDEIDLIVLDLIMPEMHGVECFHRIKAINPTAQVALCSGAYDQQIKELLDQGALKFFQKPGRYPTLITWIAEQINSAKKT